MNAGIEGAGRQVAVGPTVAPGWRRDRRFFTGMALAAAVTVFTGFAPTYFLKGVFGAPALSPLLHLHGLLFTSWILLFVAQVSLVAAGRTDLHRKLGVAGGALAVLMVVVGMAAAIGSARRGFSPPGGPPPLMFFVIPFSDLWVFSGLMGTGLYFRRRSETHKRLMLLATIALLTPAIARLPYVLTLGPPAFFGLTESMMLAVIAFGALWPILMATIHGFVTVEPRLNDVSQALGLTRLSAMVKIALPHAMPDILSGMRIALAMALILATVGEMLTGRRGLGQTILLASRSGRARATSPTPWAC